MSQFIPGSGGSSGGGIGGDVSAAPAGSVLVATGSGNNAMATGVMIDGGNNIMSNGEFTSVSGGFGFNGNYFDVLRYLRIGSDDSILIQKAAPGVLGLPASILTTTDSGTNTIVNALTLTHATSATAAANLGVALASVLPSDSGALRNAGQFVTAWNTPTNGSETSRLELHSLNVGADFIAASFSPSLTLLAGGSLSIPSIGDDGQTHLQTGSFVVTIGGAPRRILTADP